MRHVSRLILFAVICALFLGSTALAQTIDGPTLARSTPTGGVWLSPWVEAEYGQHGAGTEVVLGVIPPGGAVEIRWQHSTEVACYAYENLTPHDLGVQNGATGALHYLRVNGQHLDGIGRWTAWDGHDCGPFDGAHDWSGTSGHYGHATSGPPPGPRVALLPPSSSMRTISYVLGTAVSSTTWPSGHGYPVRAKTGALVFVAWRRL